MPKKNAGQKSAKSHQQVAKKKLDPSEIIDLPELTIISPSNLALATKMLPLKNDTNLVFDPDIDKLIDDFKRLDSPDRIAHNGDSKQAKSELQSALKSLSQQKSYDHKIVSALVETLNANQSQFEKSESENLSVDLKIYAKISANLKSWLEVNSSKKSKPKVVDFIVQCTLCEFLLNLTLAYQTLHQSTKLCIEPAFRWISDFALKNHSLDTATNKKLINSINSLNKALKEFFNAFPPTESEYGFIFAYISTLLSSLGFRESSISFLNLFKSLKFDGSSMIDIFKNYFFPKLPHLLQNKICLNTGASVNCFSLLLTYVLANSSTASTCKPEDFESPNILISIFNHISSHTNKLSLSIVNHLFKSLSSSTVVIDNKADKLKIFADFVDIANSNNISGLILLLSSQLLASRYMATSNFNESQLSIDILVETLIRLSNILTNHIFITANDLSPTSMKCKILTQFKENASDEDLYLNMLMICFSWSENMFDLNTKANKIKIDSKYAELFEVIAKLMKRSNKKLILPILSDILTNSAEFELFIKKLFGIAIKNLLAASPQIKIKLLKLISALSTLKQYFELPITDEKIFSFIFSKIANVDSSGPAREAALRICVSICESSAENFHQYYPFILSKLGDSSATIRKLVVKTIQQNRKKIIESNMVTKTVYELSLQDFNDDDIYENCYECLNYLYVEGFGELTEELKISLIKSLAEIVHEEQQDGSKFIGEFISKLHSNNFAKFVEIFSEIIKISIDKLPTWETHLQVSDFLIKIGIVDNNSLIKENFEQIVLQCDLHKKTQNTIFEAYFKVLAKSVSNKHKNSEYLAKRLTKLCLCTFQAGNIGLMAASCGIMLTFSDFNFMKNIITGQIDSTLKILDNFNLKSLDNSDSNHSKITNISRSLIKFGLCFKYFDIEIIRGIKTCMCSNMLIEKCLDFLCSSDRSLRYSAWFGIQCVIAKEPSIILNNKILAQLKSTLSDENESMRIRHIALENISTAIQGLSENMPCPIDLASKCIFAGQLIRSIPANLFDKLASCKHTPLRYLAYRVLVYIAENGLTDPKFHVAAHFTFADFANHRRIKITRVFFDTFATKYLKIMVSMSKQIIINLVTLCYGLNAFSTGNDTCLYTEQGPLHLGISLNYLAKLVCKTKRQSQMFLKGIFDDIVSSSNHSSLFDLFKILFLSKSILALDDMVEAFLEESKDQIEDLNYQCMAIKEECFSHISSQLEQCNNTKKIEKKYNKIGEAISDLDEATIQLKTHQACYYYIIVSFIKAFQSKFSKSTSINHDSSVNSRKRMKPNDFNFDEEALAILLVKTFSHTQSNICMNRKEKLVEVLKLII